MIDLLKIEHINRIIEAYFEKNSSVAIVPVKELMPAFIEAGIFTKDYKKGRPIREVLRELDRSGQRQLIPYLHAEQKANDIYWYFMPVNAAIPTTPYKQEQVQSRKEIAAIANLMSDKAYVIDLCDTILAQKAARQKRFDFLLGDLHKDGKSRTKLPVDAYYETLKLVIEFKEPQPDESDAISDQPETKTVSGVSRGEQRQIYDQRRTEVLSKHDIKLIEIPYAIFEYDSAHKIIRNSENDLQKVMEILNNDKLNEDL
jgi:hypothetical protein